MVLSQSEQFHIRLNFCMEPKCFSLEFCEYFLFVFWSIA